MIIDGPTTNRDDGSTVCIGYGLDSDGNVTGRFAVPDGYDWSSPAPTESVEYVDSMAALPDIHPDYLSA